MNYVERNVRSAGKVGVGHKVLGSASESQARARGSRAGALRRSRAGAQKAMRTLENEIQNLKALVI